MRNQCYISNAEQIFIKWKCFGRHSQLGYSPYLMLEESKWNKKLALQVLRVHSLLVPSLDREKWIKSLKRESGTRHKYPLQHQEGCQSFVCLFYFFYLQINTNLKFILGSLLWSLAAILYRSGRTGFFFFLAIQFFPLSVSVKDITHLMWARWSTKQVRRELR